MKRIVSFVVVILMLSAPGHAQPADQTDPNAIRHCQSYLDCTLVWGGCSDIAINKNFVPQFKPSSVCAASKEHDPKAVPTCTEGLCVVASPGEKK